MTIVKSASMMTAPQRVYLSGPMTGYPDYNRQAFVEAAARLRSWGYEVHSPVESNLETYGSWEEAIKHPWQEHLARDVIAVPSCDVIALMRGWQASKGANLELRIARELGFPVISAEDGVEVTASEIERAHRQRDDEPANYADVIDENRESPVMRAIGALASLADNTSPYDGERFVPYSENPERHVYTSGAIKDNKSKSRVDLIPWLPLKLVGDVLAYGAQKYKPNNWRLGLPWGDTFASLQRHLWAWHNGEDLDPETGLSHLAHAGCQLLFLSEYAATGTGVDDRWSTTREAVDRQTRIARSLERLIQEYGDDALAQTAVADIAEWVHEDLGAVA